MKFSNRPTALLFALLCLVGGSTSALAIEGVSQECELNPAACTEEEMQLIIDSKSKEEQAAPADEDPDCE